MTNKAGIGDTHTRPRLSSLVLEHNHYTYDYVGLNSWYDDLPIYPQTHTKKPIKAHKNTENSIPPPFNCRKLPNK